MIIHLKDNVVESILAFCFSYELSNSIQNSYLLIHTDTIYKLNVRSICNLGMDKNYNTVDYNYTYENKMSIRTLPRRQDYKVELTFFLLFCCYTLSQGSYVYLQNMRYTAFSCTQHIISQTFRSNYLS